MPLAEHVSIRAPAHGSNYLADDFQQEVAFFGIESSPSFVREPEGRRRWKQTSGYHGQARVENAFFRYKSIIGDSLRACSPAGRGTEVVLACNILNQMTGLGRPMSYRIGR